MWCGVVLRIVMADVTVFLKLYFIISISIRAPPLTSLQLPSFPLSHSLTLTLHMRASACLTVSTSESVPVPVPVSALTEILEEHFTRHSKGGKSTKVIVFTQLRSTVRAIVADLADTKGVWVTILRHAQKADRLTVLALADALFTRDILFYVNSSIHLYLLLSTIVTLATTHSRICRCVCAGLHRSGLQGGHRESRSSEGAQSEGASCHSTGTHSQTMWREYAEHHSAVQLSRV